MDLRRFEAYWNTLGRRDPFSAILIPGARGTGAWDVDAFFATARTDALRFIADLTRIAPDAGRRRALDFGCGVGRITRPLADHFESVDAVREFLRVLKPGGALMFQLPGVVAIDPEQAFCDAPVTGGALKRHVPRAIVRLYRRFKYRVVLRSSLTRMEMFGMDLATVESLIAAAGGRLLEVRSDQSHGTEHPGFEYWVTRS